jgi:hypothetical protein
MAQQMWVNELREVRGLPSIPADAMHHACRDRARPEVAGKEPGPRFLLLPIVAYQREELRREHDRAIVLAFALPHPQDHARAVDIGDLQLTQCRHPHPRRRERGEEGPMFEGARGGP